MKEKVKELRVRIDGLTQLVNDLKPKEFLSARHIIKTYDDLLLGKAWLGKVLGELGTESPYANDGSRKTVGDIESAADTSDELNWIKQGSWTSKVTGIDLNYIEKVDWLRQEIQKVIKEVDNIPLTLQMISDKLNVSAYQSKIHLSEARFWLGFELQRIKEEDGN